MAGKNDIMLPNRKYGIFQDFKHTKKGLETTTTTKIDDRYMIVRETSSKGNFLD